MIIDSDMIGEIPGNVERVYKVPATSIARNKIGAPITANMAMLGALCNVTGVVSRQALEKAIVKAVPSGKEQMNLEAFHMGFESVGSD